MSLTLKALKSFRYPPNIRLQPGEIFQAKTERDAFILTLALGGKSPMAVKVEKEQTYGTRALEAENKAEEGKSRKPEAQDDSAQSKEDSAQDRESLRAQYQALYEKRPFPGWNEEQLIEKIRYKRRDMRAED